MTPTPTSSSPDQPETCRDHRRFNMAFDLDTMEMLNDREVYFEVNDWVNKSLRFRDVGVFFDECGKDEPDFMIRMQRVIITVPRY